VSLPSPCNSRIKNTIHCNLQCIVYSKVVIKKVKRPRGNGTGPTGRRLRDGSGRKADGRGQQGGQKGQGAKTGGKKEAANILK
jgi:hypothetical protein